MYDSAHDNILSPNHSEKERSPNIRAVSFTLKFIIFSLTLALCTTVCGFIFRSCAETLSADTGNLTAISDSGADFIIDAGHGGMDGGASAADGTVEKGLNLALSDVLRGILDVLGYNAVMTRTDDEMLSDGGKGTNKLRDLRARMEIAKTNPDALFLSIHMNKFPNTSLTGLQVWYSPNHPSSETTARLIQSAFKTYISPDNKREIKKAGSNIYLLDRIKNPAVLVECGFLSNVTEAKHLSDSAYRRQLASVIAVAAVMSHIKE
jgi:N-acetylmuramoyl-L-alanine amidase